MRFKHSDRDSNKSLPKGLRNLSALVFIGAHIPLAISMNEVNQIATLHALATVTVGLCWLCLRNSLERAAYLSAYIVGAEVLWRMTRATVFWEFGKYAIAVVLLVAMVRTGRLRGTPVPILYFALLLCSAVFTFQYLDFNEARMQFSFNMSGPFALMVSVLFFSHLKLSVRQLRTIIIMIIAPLVGIAMLILVNVYTTSSFGFSDRGSNFVITGGFGPNQVSAILSLGALMALLYVLCVKSDWTIKAILFGLSLLFGAESALTFSRAGIYMAIASITLSSLCLIRDTRNRLKVVAGIALLVVLANYVILPKLDTFTNHAVVGRFKNTYETGREEIAMDELRLWSDNLFLGVGPGVSMFMTRDSNGRVVASHTEFTRLLVEHGLPGFLALLMLFAMAVVNVRRQDSPKNRAFVVAILVWAFLFMAVNAMRIVAPSFLLGLASMYIFSDQKSSQLTHSSPSLRFGYPLRRYAAYVHE